MQSGSDRCVSPCAAGDRDRRGAAVPHPLHAPGRGQGQQLVAAAPPPRAGHEVQGGSEESRDLQRHRSVCHRHHRRGEGCPGSPCSAAPSRAALCAGLPLLCVAMGDSKQLGDPGPAWWPHKVPWQSVWICLSHRPGSWSLLCASMSSLDSAPGSSQQ